MNLPLIRQTSSRLIQHSSICSDVSYHAAGCMERLGLAIQLIPESFYVIWPVCDDNTVLAKQPLYSRHFGCARILLFARRMVYLGLQSQALVVDVMDLQPCNSRIGRSRDAVRKVLHELRAAVCLARTREPRDHQQLLAKRVSKLAMALDCGLRHTGIVRGGEEKTACKLDYNSIVSSVNQADCALAARVWNGSCLENLLYQTVSIITSLTCPQPRFRTALGYAMLPSTTLAPCL